MTDWAPGIVVPKLTTGLVVLQPLPNGTRHPLPDTALTLEDVEPIKNHWLSQIEGKDVDKLDFCNCAFTPEALLALLQALIEAKVGETVRAALFHNILTNISSARDKGDGSGETVDDVTPIIQALVSLLEKAQLNKVDVSNNGIGELLTFLFRIIDPEVAQELYLGNAGINNETMYQLGRHYHQRSGVLQVFSAPRNNASDGRGFKEIFVNNKKLRIVDCEGNKPDPTLEGSAVFFEGLHQLEKPKILWVPNWKLGTGALDTHPICSVANLPLESLDTLNLSESEMGVNGCKLLLTAMDGRALQLKQLILKKIHLEGVEGGMFHLDHPSMTELMRLFSKLRQITPKLEVLDLHGCRMPDQLTAAVVEGLGTSMKVLTLSKNFIGDATLAALNGSETLSRPNLQVTVEQYSASDKAVNALKMNYAKVVVKTDIRPDSSDSEISCMTDVSSDSNPQWSVESDGFAPSEGIINASGMSDPNVSAITGTGHNTTTTNISDTNDESDAINVPSSPPLAQRLRSKSSGRSSPY